MKIVLFIVILGILGSSVMAMGQMSSNQDDDYPDWFNIFNTDDNNSWFDNFEDLFDFNKLMGFLSSEDSQYSGIFDGGDDGDHNPPPPNCRQDPTVTTTVDPITGDVQVIYEQSRNLNDNSYGENAIGWEFRNKGHTFRDLKNSDNLQFQFKDSSDAVVLDFYLDYLS